MTTGARLARAAALAAAVIAAACRGSDASGRGAFHALQVGDPVPEYRTTSLTGDTARVGPGQPVTILNVWATWCTSCREEMATLEALHREFAARGLRVLAVSVDRINDDRVRQYVARQRLTFMVAHDADGLIEQRYQIVGVPTTLLMDGAGTLRWEHVGAINGIATEARAAVERSLQPTH